MDDRFPDQVVTMKRAPQAQKNNRTLQIFKASQWRRNCRFGTRLMYPPPPLNDEEFWNTHYRLLLDRKWLRDSEFRYHFYTGAEVMEVVGRLMGFERQED